MAVAFKQIFSCSVSPAAPQSVLLLRLHHGRMPDSLYGNLSSLRYATLQCNSVFSPNDWPEFL